jgi:hypothetical protein
MIDEYTNNISKFVREHSDLRIQNLSSKINEDVLLEIHRRMEERQSE